MPGFTTHYLFGQQTYQKLRPSRLKRMIQKYHRVFCLGLQGPDIFFYDLISWCFGNENPGPIAHTTNTGALLSHLLETPELFSTEKERDIARTYVLGFIGHYLLDSTCHPYVYARTGYGQEGKYSTWRHLYLESDIDRTLLWFYQHRHPSEFHQDESIALTKEQANVLSILLYSAFHETFPDMPLSRHTILRAMYAIRKETGMLRDPSGRKKALIRRFEGLVPGYPVLSPLVPSDTLLFHPDPCNRKRRMWRNPWDKSLSSTESFFDLFDSAQKEYSRLLNAISHFFSMEHRSIQKEEALSLLLARLGNRDYHSGL